jgi:death-on-curing protein
VAEGSGEPTWLSRLVIDAIQQDLIATHGGVPGIRDEGLVESALARPRQAFAYGTAPDVVALAASYGYGIARNHPYHDGNKRIAFMAIAVFTELNGFELEASEADVVDVMLRLAAGDLDEGRLADWLRAHLLAAGDSNSL